MLAFLQASPWGRTSVLKQTVSRKQTRQLTWTPRQTVPRGVTVLLLRILPWGCTLPLRLTSPWGRNHLCAHDARVCPCSYFSWLVRRCTTLYPPDAWKRKDR